MRNHRWLCLTIALIGAAPVAASAADAYGYPAEPPNFAAGSGGGYGAPVVTNWSGVYLGGQFGLGWGDVGDGNLDGPLAGGTIGINGQWGQVLFGAEADGSWSGLKGTFRNNDFEMNALGTIRGRVGYAFDRFVAYGTGGVAFSSLEKTSGRTDSATYFGWTAGAGMEVALTGNISAKLEYLYVDLDSQDFRFGRSQPVDLSANLVRAGLNYRF